MSVSRPEGREEQEKVKEKEDENEAVVKEF